MIRKLLHGLLVAMILWPIATSAQVLTNTNGVTLTPVTFQTAGLQGSGATCSVQSACLQVHLPINANGAALTLAGTFVATAQFEESGDNQITWPTNVGSSSAVGLTTVSFTGITDIRIRLSAYTSGTVTATINVTLNTGLAGPTGPAGTASNIVAIDATNSKYGLKYDAHWVFDATTTTGANPTVTCLTTNDCNFTSTDTLGRPIAKVGQIVWAVCGPIQGTTGATATLDIAQTTITSINGPQSITVGGTGASACAGNLIPVWGDDDGAALTSFWLDVTGNPGRPCGQGHLPAAGMLIQSGQFNTGGTGECSANLNGVVNNSLGLTGQGIYSTFLVATPNFDFTIGSGHSCSGFGPSTVTGLAATVQNVCNFGAPGMDLENLTLTGWGNPLSGTNPGSLTFLAGNAAGKVNNLRVGFWGTLAGANLKGFTIYQSTFLGNILFNCDNFGYTCLSLNGITGTPNPGTQVSFGGGGGFIGDNFSTDATLQANVVVGPGASLQSTGNEYGFCAGTCAGVRVFGRFLSTVDRIETSGAGGTAAVIADGTNGAGTGQVTLVADDINTLSGSPFANGVKAQNGGIIRLNGDVVYSGTGSTLVADATSELILDDTNTFHVNGVSTLNVVSGSQIIANGTSATGTCTGTVPSSSGAGGFGLYGDFGSNITALACSAGTANGKVMAINGGNGVVYAVVATYSVGGIAGDAMTVFKNGVATTMSAVIGTGTFASDSAAAHAFAFNKGDRISCQVITGAAETGQNPTCTIYWDIFY